MPKPKHEYEVRVTYTEVHSVYVEAEDWETAEELAEEKFHKGETEMKYSRVDTEVDWSNEEKVEVELPDEED